MKTPQQNQFKNIDRVRVEEILGEQKTVNIEQMLQSAIGWVRAKVPRKELADEYLKFAPGGFVEFESGPLYDQGLRIGFLLNDPPGRLFRVGIYEKGKP